MLSRRGLVRLTPGYDLTWKQLPVLLAHCPAARCEVVLHQHVPLFHTRHCLFAASLSDGTKCGDCGWRCESHGIELLDRNGAAHPVLSDSMGRSTVFNAAVQSAAEHLPQMKRVGLRHFRVELLRESPAQARDLLALYARLLADDVGRPALLRRLRALCPAGVTRGTPAHERVR